MSAGKKFSQKIIGFIVGLALAISVIRPPAASAQKEDDIQRNYNAQTGKVTHITGLGGDPIVYPSAMESNMDSKQRSDALVNYYAQEFGLTRPQQELRLAEESQPASDRVVTRYEQVYNGVPVIAGELIVNAGDNGALHSMNGEVSQGLSLATAPELSVETAIYLAKQAMVKWYGGGVDDYTASDAVLSIFDESLIQPSNRPAELVWRMDLTPANQLQPVREFVLVNDKTGNISFHFNQVDTAWHTHSQKETVTPPVTVQPSQPSTTIESAPLQVGATWYVATTGNDSNSCSAPASPCAFISVAISRAAEGDTVRVAGGTYDQSFNINKDLIISGGWDSSFISQNQQTTLGGQNTYSRISIGLDVTAEIDRIVVKNSNIGINNQGTTIVRNVGLVSNGQGALNNWTGTLNLINVTAIQNSSGITNHGILTVQNSTISYNSGTGIENGYIVSTATTIQNSILTNNIPNCSITSGSVTSTGYNIIGLTSGCSMSIHATDTTNIDAQMVLLPSLGLAAIKSNSPAINYANAATCPSSDQRGIARPQNGGCDSGSYERTTPGSATAMYINAGGQQYAIFNTAFSSPLDVVVVDSLGNLVSGVNVTFTAPSSGPSAIFASTGTNVKSSVTDVNGVSTSGSLTANSQLGSYSVPATVAGLPTQNFQLTNTTTDRFVSNSGNDSNTCDTPSVPCLTINAAINKAGSGSTVKVATGTYTGTSSAVVTTSKNITISGGWNGAFSSQNGQTIINGQNVRQGILVNSGITASLNDLTIQNGYSSQGAGIYNQGNLTLRDVAIVNNRTYNDGAGIYQKSGQLDLENVTISNNTAKSSGGGIYVYDGTVTINNSTITQNFATDPGGSAIGGGLSNYFNKLVTIKNTLVAGNSADSVPDCRGQFTSGGNNLIGFGDGCTLSPASGDQIGAIGSPINAMLGNLSDNGGGTLTHALMTGSPAIDAGNPATCAATDQRGVARPQGSACDIGAFEGSESQTISAVVRTYSTGGGSEIPGTLLCDQTDPTCTEGVNLDADKAHQYALGVYDLYKTQHGRNGLDQNNMPIISSVDYCSPYFCPYDNAFWTGGQVVYGDLNSLADDVVAHELTHGVTQYESGLLYYYQSGAINESFSDLWGEYYDQTNGLGNDDGSVRWLIGEDVTGSPISRSMSNPPAYGDPDTMISGLYNKKAYYEDFWDNGGVHSNSGVNNKAVYLMVDGGTFGGKTVTALGWHKTAKIYYEAQTNLLSSGADYSDLYFALQQACTNLTGQFGITSADCLEVKDALDAVQMNSQPVANFNPDAPICPTGMVTVPALTLLEDNLESGLGNWTTDPYWTLENWYSSSATHMLYGEDEFTYANGELRLDPFVVPAGAFLHFKHAFAFEYYGGSNYDGGVLEYSTNGGATWVDAKPLFSAGQDYKGTIFSGFGNVLGGRSGFVNDSHGYVSSRYNLASLAGQTVQFRWRLGTDDSFYYFGWFVDDVRVYSCSGTPSVPTLQAPTANALITDYTPLLNWSDATSVAHYELQVATDTAFTALVYNETNVLVSQFDIPTELAHNTKFYWRVRAVNTDNEVSNWSAVNYFRTLVDPPVLLTPTQGSFVNVPKPTFDWADTPGPASITGYTIQISTSPTFASLLVNATTVTSTYTPIINLPSGATIYWRVRTNGANGPSNWSPVVSFTDVW